MTSSPAEGRGGSPPGLAPQAGKSPAHRHFWCTSSEGIEPSKRGLPRTAGFEHDGERHVEENGAILSLVAGFLPGGRERSRRRGRREE
jgi:hypothetical protein